ncbi:MAG: hypothetical protein J5705_06685 [Bacteroidaceae bacterium]|nr:hypothetical protein [Bacteroidaceae bacterium]
MKKTRLSIIVLAALLVTGMAVTKSRNGNRITYDNVEALTDGDNGNIVVKHVVYSVHSYFAQDTPYYIYATDSLGNLTTYCTTTYNWYTPTKYACTESEED